MAISQRPFTNERGYSKDFHLVEEFIARINKDKMTNHHFIWGRWEWAFALRYLDRDNLSKMGLWEDNGLIVGAVLYEDDLGKVYILIDPAYEYLKKEMLDYATEHLHKDGKVMVLIDNNDRELGQYARSQGFRPIEWFEENALLDIDVDAISYDLPEGYKIISFEDEYDVLKHNACLWSGFNHEGEPPTTQEDLTFRQNETEAPNQDKSLLIAAVAPNGEYVAYCGMWHRDGEYYTLVEPVCTHAKYRKLGLGKAVVLEGVKRCGLRGAKVAYVGSKQQFYYNIGFNPISTGTMWELKK